MYHHSTTDIQTDNMAYERNRLQLYQQFLQLLLQMAQREEAQQLPDIRELKQARTATAVNKQLNFTVRNKPHTTNYIYCIFEAYFMIKSV